MYWKIIVSLFNNTVEQENCKRKIIEKIKNSLEDDKKHFCPSSLVFVYEQEKGFQTATLSFT